MRAVVFEFTFRELKNKIIKKDIKKSFKRWRFFFLKLVKRTKWAVCRKYKWKRDAIGLQRKCFLILIIIITHCPEPKHCNICRSVLLRTPYAYRHLHRIYLMLRIVLAHKCNAWCTLHICVRAYVRNFVKIWFSCPRKSLTSTRQRIARFLGLQQQALPMMFVLLRDKDLSTN